MKAIDLLIEQLRSEAIPELRRAAEDLAAMGVLDCLCELYEKSEPYTPPPEIITKFCAESSMWFSKIPVEVRWVDDGQPFQTMGQMSRFVKRNGYLPMYRASSVLHSSYHRHRAVHDYFGHIEPNIPFGAVGELAAYRLHKRMYSVELHPLIFSDVVLNNVYFEMNGQFYASEKYIKAEEQCLRSHS